MSEVAPEFSRIVPLSRIGVTGLRREISATPAEREALCRRFGLVALDRLTAIVDLVRRDRDEVRLEADLSAEFVQECVVSLDPVPGTLATHFTLRYGPADAEEDVSAEFLEGEEDFEPLTGEAIDIGEAVSQEFSLALPEFPRHPDAVVESEAGIDGPFAVLARLRDASAR